MKRILMATLVVLATATGTNAKDTQQQSVQFCPILHPDCLMIFIALHYPRW